MGSCQQVEAGIVDEADDDLRLIANEAGRLEQEEAARLFWSS